MYIYSCCVVCGKYICSGRRTLILISLSLESGTNESIFTQVYTNRTMCMGQVKMNQTRGKYTRPPLSDVSGPFICSTSSHVSASGGEKYTCICRGTNNPSNENYTHKISVSTTAANTGHLCFHAIYNRNQFSFAIIN